MYGNLAHDKLVSSKDWREKINIHSTDMSLKI